MSSGRPSAADATRSILETGKPHATRKRSLRTVRKRIDEQTTDAPRAFGRCSPAIALACVLTGSAAGDRAAPTITGFAPNHGLLGERVTIYGHDLAAAGWFNFVPADNVVVDPTGTHVRVNAPGEISPGPARSR